MTAFTPFKVIQGHRFWCHTKARRPISNFLLVNNTNAQPVLHRFQIIARVYHTLECEAAILSFRPSVTCDPRLNGSWYGKHFASHDREMFLVFCGQISAALGQLRQTGWRQTHILVAKRSRTNTPLMRNEEIPN